LTDAPLPRLQAIGWTVAFFGVGIVLSIVAGLALHAAGAGDLVAEVLAELVGFGLATWIIGVHALGLDAVALRYRGDWRGARRFGAGLLLGVVPALLALVLAVPAGSRWSVGDGTAGGWAVAVLRLLLLLAPAAFAEEVIFRGAGLVALARAFGRWPAILTLSLLFGLAHAGNQHVTPLAVANVVLAGLFLSAAFYLPGGIWTSTGTHLGWNATLAALGAPVSGLPFAIPWLSYRSDAPAWVSGGAFGPEGGAIASVVILGALAFTIRRSLARKAA
jgi:membrane protease YdiL (CAAX protease family)